MELFMINGTDYTNYITVPSYNVTQKMESTEWTDSNGTRHHDVYKRRISGSFTMKFFTTEDYLSFQSVIQNSIQTDGSINIVAYVNNLNEKRSFRAFVNIDNLPNVLPYIGAASYDGFSVEIEER